KGLMDDENQKMLDAIENDENVTQEQKDQLSELELKISDNSTAITKKQEAITSLEGSIASAETEIAAFNTSISEKQGQISDLSGTISGLREQLNAVQGDDEAAVSQRQSFKSQIDTKNTELQALKTQLDEEIAAKQAKESEKADLESQLQTARDEKAQLDANETDLLNQKTELLDQFKENATPETKAIIDNYETLKKAYEDSKTEVKTCETNLDTSRAKLNEVNASLNTKNAELSEVTSVLATKENEKAQAVSDTGQVEIPDFVPDVDQKFIRQLHPEMQAKVVEFYKAAKDAGLEFAINYEGQVRTLGQQEELKRSNARRYGTPNPFGTSSMHLMGLAIDISPIKGSYAQLGAIGKSVGLTWGGDFKSNGSIEQHHFQFDAPIIALQSQYGKGTVECNRMIALNYPCFKAFGSNKRYELNSVYSVEELRGKGYKC
ncbi:M15 family metallopeptidase, partial [bacterium]|nr:M15 family metallopeptidase [bacterium]